MSKNIFFRKLRFSREVTTLSLLFTKTFRVLLLQARKMRRVAAKRKQIIRYQQTTHDFFTSNGFLVTILHPESLSVIGHRIRILQIKSRKILLQSFIAICCSFKMNRRLIETTLCLGKEMRTERKINRRKR
jgi:hypothetical protein